MVDRYEEAREEEKLRSQKEDFSDMVAEVRNHIYIYTHFNLLFNSKIKSCMGKIVISRIEYQICSF